MIVIQPNLNLEQLRSAAKLTQSELASQLGLVQSQVSRYEQDPDSIPAGLLRRWMEVCGYMAGNIGLEIEDPRVELNARVNLMKAYADVEPQWSAAAESQDQQLSASGFLSAVNVTARKPTVGLFGFYDSGKSRLLNVILGGDRLPTRYQPMTSVMCLIRHLNDKPAWQAEDVWLFSKGFDFSKADDAEHCINHRLIAGGVESLKQYGTHDGSGREPLAQAAVVYINAPVLLSVDMMDFPGYGHGVADDQRAEMGQKLVDVAIYTSTTAGFMDQTDMQCMSTILRQLPLLGSNSVKLDPLANLYVVATHAHTVPHEAQRTEILDLASIRMTKHLEPAFTERCERAGTPINQTSIRSRMFTFSADDASIRSGLISDFTQLLSDTLPKLKLAQLDLHVRASKASAAHICDHWILRLQTALTARDDAQAEVTAIEKAEPVRLRKKATHQKKIGDMIENFSTESKDLVASIYADRANIGAIESMIRNRYDDKKEAQQYAASYLVNSIQKSIDDALKVKSNAFAQEVDGFLADFGPAVDVSPITGGSFEFDARVAFISSLAGIGTVGALATWATIAAAGSNLGGYILVAQIVGWLSSIGVSLGSSATIMAIVSTIGGPITLAIAAGIGIAALAASIFGDSWQTKLAKKIRDELVKNSAQNKMIAGIEQYWADTKAAFTQAVERTESLYQDRLNRLRVLAFSTDRESIEVELARAKETRDFFAGMPWKALS